MAKKEHLKTGQIVWIEAQESLLRGQRKRSIKKYEVVNVNNTSAYVIPVDKKEEYFEEKKKFFLLRVNQRTHKVITTSGWGTHYVLWLDEESFNNSITGASEYKEYLIRAQTIIDSMSLEQLKQFVNENGGI